MTPHSSENLLRTYYDTFDNQHAKCRDKLLDSLVATQVVPRTSTGRRLPVWLSGLRLATAAVLLVATGSLIFLFGGPTKPAYGLEHLAERLATIRSLHLKGWMAQTITTPEGEEKVERFPTELYARRPDCIGFRTYGFSHPGNGKPTIVTSGFSANDGKQVISVSDKDKRAILGSIQGDDLQTGLMVESFIQSSVAEKFLQGPPEFYRKVRAEEIQSVLCDVYEFNQQEEGSVGLHRIWLNPLTGIPVKSEASSVDTTGAEKLLTREFIEVDVEPPLALFSFEAPEGYELTTVQAQDAASAPTSGVKLLPYGEGGSGTTWLASWYSFNVNDRAVLACWSQYDKQAETKEYFARQPQFELHQGSEVRTCREHTISTNVTESSQWRWSLILPDDSKPIGGSTLRMKVSDKKTRTSQEVKPLRLERERLRTILLEAQRRTLSDESRHELFTLEGLEAIKDIEDVEAINDIEAIE